MKTKRFFAAILSMALCVNFVSCGDDDDNDIINQGNGSKRLVNCTVKKQTYGFTYGSDGKLSSMVYDKDHYDISFSGNEAIATTISTSGKYTTDIDTVWFTLNEKGYCTSAINKFIEKWGPSPEESDGHIDIYKFTYDSDNQMIKAEEDDGIEEIEEFEYKDGVMISSSSVKVITYTGIPNIGNLFVAYDSEICSAWDYYPCAWRFAGLLGKAPKFLPKTAEWYEGKETYDYELDEEGYVKKVEVTFLDTNGKESHDTYDFNYESIK